MKKAFLIVLVLALGSVIYADDMHFCLTLGTLTDDSFSFSPFTWSLGGELDFHMGNYIMISPEATFYADTSFSTWSLVLAPGATFNIKAGPLYFGAGAVKFLALGTGAASDFNLKLNIGLRANHFRVAGYWLTPFKNLFTYNSVGLFLGFEF